MCRNGILVYMPLRLLQSPTMNCSIYEIAVFSLIACILVTIRPSYTKSRCVAAYLRRCVHVLQSYI